MSLKLKLQPSYKTGSLKMVKFPFMDTFECKCFMLMIYSTLVYKIDHYTDEVHKYFLIVT